MPIFILNNHPAQLMAYFKCYGIKCLLALLMIVSVPCYAFQDKPYQKVEDVPNPKDTGTGYVSDSQGTLQGNELDSLNRILADLNHKTGVEAAVVIVNDFNENSDDFTFATELFRHWGIGKRNADNGLLLFITTGRKQYRFVTGYGLEGLLPDAALKRIGEGVLVPAFKQQNYGKGIISAMQVVNQYFLQPANKKELNSLLKKQTPVLVSKTGKVIWLSITILLALVAGRQIQRFKSTIPATKVQTPNLYSDILDRGATALIVIFVLFAVIDFFLGSITALFSMIFRALPVLCCIVIVLYLFFAHLNVLNRLRNHYKDDVNFARAVKTFYLYNWWHVLLSPLTLIFMLIELLRSRNITKRATPLFDESEEPMNRIDRDLPEQGQAYLLAGQLKEEEIGSISYDIWKSNKNQSVKLVPNPGYHHNDFDTCPKCGFRTFTSKPIDVPMQAATYTHQGRGKRVRLCRNCHYEEFIKDIIIAMLARSTDSSSSSSGSGGSSSSSSSSSSGSWGGGSTGGGGAGGSW